VLSKGLSQRFPRRLLVSILALPEGRALRGSVKLSNDPSVSLLGWSGSRPIHVVAANDAPAQETIIVTVYQPDIEEWESGFKRRKRR